MENFDKLTIIQLKNSRAQRVGAIIDLVAANTKLRTLNALLGQCGIHDGSNFRKWMREKTRTDRRSRRETKREIKIGLNDFVSSVNNLICDKNILPQSSRFLPLEYMRIKLAEEIMETEDDGLNYKVVLRTFGELSVEWLEHGPPCSGEPWWSRPVGSAVQKKCTFTLREIAWLRKSMRFYLKAERYMRGRVAEDALINAAKKVGIHDALEASKRPHLVRKRLDSRDSSSSKRTRLPATPLP